MGCMHDFYQQAPYPSLEKLMLWTKDEKDREAINKKYAEFDKNPCAIDGHDGREKENGFKRADAKNFLKKMLEKESSANFGESGSRFEIRPQGESQTSVT